MTFLLSLSKFFFPLVSDGFISKEELKAVINETKAQVTDGELDEFIQNADENGDGMISVEEWKLFSKKRSPEAIQQQHALLQIDSESEIVEPSDVIHIFQEKMSMCIHFFEDADGNQSF